MKLDFIASASEAACARWSASFFSCSAFAVHALNSGSRFVNFLRRYLTTRSWSDDEVDEEDELLFLCLLELPLRLRLRLRSRPRSFQVSGPPPRPKMDDWPFFPCLPMALARALNC